MREQTHPTDSEGSVGSVSAPPNPRHYDLVILGGGSAGIVSGVMAGGLGLRVLLIEKYRMGGECLNTGCVPSKALLHAAHVAQQIQSGAATVGLPTRPLSRDETRRTLAWVRDSIRTVRDADATERLLTDNGITIRKGDAQFSDSRTLRLHTDGGEETVTADAFLIATGSRPAVPDDVPGLSQTPYVTNQTVFDLDEIPERLLVLGGGPNGVEMSQAFGRLGSRVTLVQRGEQLLPRDDAELVGLLTDRLRSEGVDIRLNTRLERITDPNIAVLRAGDGTTDQVAFDCLLVTVGRQPNVEALGLDAAGVVVGRDGIEVDRHLRTANPRIWACGDVIADGYRFSHLAEYQAKIAVRNLVFPGSTSADYRAAPWTTFTDPELAHVGLTEDEAKKQNRATDVYRQPFAQNDRALTDANGVSADAGMVKVLVEPGPRGKILGAQILGPRAGELLQEWVYAMEQGHGIRAIADMVHVYPTLTLASQHAAQRWYERQAQQPAVRRALRTYVQTVRPHEKAIALALGVAAAGATLLHLSRRDQADRTTATKGKNDG